MDRRHFIAQSALAAGSLALGASSPTHSLRKDTTAWKGFNLLEKFNADQAKPFEELDFRFMKEYGFRFARIPMSYLCWTTASDWKNINQQQMREIDDVVALGRKYGIHINLNLHRIPGFCINPPEEPFNLWKDEKALDAARFQWAMLAKRYKGIPAYELSFDLINEPARGEEADYVRVAKALIESIRNEDPNRMIVADGWEVGRKPVYGLADSNVIQSCRGYDPMMISHYKANWWHYKGEWPETIQWPWQDWNREKIIRERIKPWQEIEKKGVLVHVGEWGCYNQTPHAVALAWMEEMLSIWKEADWGWSLWNLRGSFGILNSGRKDVVYEDYRGMKLDRKMMELLLKYN
jgi:endoglucanase